MSKFYIEAATQTQADVFAITGLARLISSGGEAVDILAEGNHFVLETESLPLTSGDGVGLSNTQLYSFLLDGVSTPVSGIHLYDWQSKKEKEAEKKEQRDVLRAQIDKDPSLRRNSEIKQRQDELIPDPEYRLHNVFKTMQAYNAANKVLEAVHKAKDWPNTLRSALISLQNPFAAIPKTGLPAVTNQLINPLVAKGYKRLKPDTTQRTNPNLNEVGDHDFIQYLRYGGYFISAAPFQDKKGNLRLVVPVPKRISYNNFHLVATRLRSSRFGAKRVKLDVLASLRVAELLINYSEYGENELPDFLRITNLTPADLISGVYVTHYMKTSQFVTNVMEMTLVSVPAWFPVRSKSDADDWRIILGEHKNVLQSLVEDNSDEIGLLIQYRNALQSAPGDSFQRLIDFMCSYGAYWISAVNKPTRRMMSRFTTTGLERMAQNMASEMLTILNDPGFQEVARAIRKATVSAQAQKAMARSQMQGGNVKKPWREIRYGLIPEINRKRFVEEELVETISLFVSSYNAENARRRETEAKVNAAPRNISTEGLESLCRLIGEHGSPLVGSLLCAYGSCREPRDVDEETLEAGLEPVDEANNENETEEDEG